MFRRKRKLDVLIRPPEEAPRAGSGLGGLVFYEPRWFWRVGNTNEMYTTGYAESFVEASYAVDKEINDRRRKAAEKRAREARDTRYKVRI